MLRCEKNVDKNKLPQTSGTKIIHLTTRCFLFLFDVLLVKCLNMY